MKNKKITNLITPHWVAIVRLCYNFIFIFLNLPAVQQSIHFIIKEHLNKNYYNLNAA